MISEFVAIKMFGGKQKQNDEVAKKLMQKEEGMFWTGFRTTALWLS